MSSSTVEYIPFKDLMSLHPSLSITRDTHVYLNLLLDTLLRQISEHLALSLPPTLSTLRSTVHRVLPSSLASPLLEDALTGVCGRITGVPRAFVSSPTPHPPPSSPRDMYLALQEACRWEEGSAIRVVRSLDPMVALWASEILQSMGRIIVQRARRMLRRCERRLLGVNELLLVMEEEEELRGLFTSSGLGEHMSERVIEAIKAGKAKPGQVMDTDVILQADAQHAVNAHARQSSMHDHLDEFTTVSAANFYAKSPASTPPLSRSGTPTLPLKSSTEVEPRSRTPLFRHNVFGFP